MRVSPLQTITLIIFFIIMSRTLLMLVLLTQAVSALSVQQHAMISSHSHRAMTAASMSLHQLTSNKQMEPKMATTTIDEKEEESELMVDRTDPCNAHENCGRCSEDSRCGWCAANSQCMIGSPDGPKMQVCASWTKGFCEVSKCGDYSHCMSCLADPYCGWCTAPSDDPNAEIPGKCMEGGSSGPGDAEGECPDQWRHSPVRKGTGYALASHLASAHAPYLREICESASGKIPYAPPPPPEPPMKAKDPMILTMFPRDGPIFGGTHITITGMWFGYSKTDQEVTIGELIQSGRCF